MGRCKRGKESLSDSQTRGNDSRARESTGGKKASNFICNSLRPKAPL